jgi:excisionase family DNA binding protein
MAEDKRYLTLKQCKEIANISSSTLRTKIKNGQLRALRPSQKIMIERSDLDAFMQANESKPKVG